jgi:hypothetical protein
MKQEELLDVVVNKLLAEGVTGNNYTSFKALRVLRKCVMGRKLVCYLISGNEIRVQQRLAELSQNKQIMATESFETMPYIKQ